MAPPARATSSPQPQPQACPRSAVLRGPQAYAKVLEIIAGRDFEGIEVYSFRVFQGARIAIRLDDVRPPPGPLPLKQLPSLPSRCPSDPHS